MISRRLFIGGSLILGATAPAIVRSESLMKLWVPPQELIPAGVASEFMLFKNGSIHVCMGDTLIVTREGPQGAYQEVIHADRAMSVSGAHFDGKGKFVRLETIKR